MKRWLVAIGKVALVGLLVWHFGVVLASSLPDRSTSALVQSVRATVLPYSDPYAYTLGQWQTWGMFSQQSVQRVFKHRIQAWDPAKKEWVTVKKLGFQELPFWTKATDTALLRSLERNEVWPSRERYLQLMCGELGLAPETWVRMGYEYFDMPLDETFDPSQWNDWEPTWYEWDDWRQTRCPDPTLPEDQWPHESVLESDPTP